MEMTNRDWPDPLSRSTEEWQALFTTEMYGEALPVVTVKTQIVGTPLPLGGAHVRVETGLLGPVNLYYFAPPKIAPKATFVGLNFGGNQTVFEGHSSGAGWPLEKIVARGYAVATVCYEEFAPDNRDAPIYQTDYRGISLWAWGMSRVVDALEQQGNKGPFIALGHSRVGKAALVAGMRDARFSVVIANQSGCGGAAPSRGTVGESVERINTVFPHWFADSFKKYNTQTDQLPFDQHCLIATLAPRPVLLTCAEDDTWANPVGQFEVLKAAHPAYLAHAGDGLTSQTMPSLNALSEGRLGYWIRPGGHAMSPDDWATYLTYADKWV
jgi:hypothetical protein